MKTSQYGIDLIKHFEGCELKAYQCAAGVWTIGYGHTKGVQPGDQWSESHANHMLEVELEEYENCLLYTSPSPRDRQKSRMPSSA